MLTKQTKAGRVLTGLLAGLFLSTLDQTIVSTAMPNVVQELGGFSLYSWVFTVYMLASTTTMPIYGKLADIWGRRTMYVTGCLLFLIGSALCGQAGSMTELIVFRGIQGLGAGALMPISMTIVADLYPPEKRGKFMGLLGAAFALSSILGPVLGGVIVEQWGWGWIFLINLPIGIPALLLVATSLQEQKRSIKPVIDWLGALTLSSATVSILLALVWAGDIPGSAMSYSWSSPVIIGLLAAGAGLLAVFLWIQTKTKEPLLPLRLFRVRTITVGHVVGFFMSAGMFAAIVYLPLFAQAVLGVSSARAGYILMPLMLAVVVTSVAGGRLMSRLSYRALLVPSLALMTIGFIGFSQLGVDTSGVQLIGFMIIAGLGMGAVYPTVGTAAQSAADIQDRGVATSSSQFFRSMGGTVGISVLGSLLTRSVAAGTVGLKEQAGGMPAERLENLSDPQLLLNAGARLSLPPELLAGLQRVWSESLGTLFTGGLIFVIIALAASFGLGRARLVEKRQEIRR
ncbi:MDR family MFS transporter [Paenibacillus filicis]|uniref:MDR family MFS transporter n=1 Tax=Paenibacillus filicis TaxID=669464 RepID=A0ABU9DIB4_9BACL